MIFRPETNHTPSNIRSQGFESSATPAFIFVVVYSAVGLTGVANPKAALQSKASSATFIFRVIHPIGGSARNYGPHAQSTDPTHSHVCIVVLIGVEPISTLLGKVLLGYEPESNSRHFGTHLPADITWDCPACSPCNPRVARSSQINRHRFRTFRRGRCAMPHLAIN